MNRQTLIQIILVLLFVAGPALAGLWKKLEEKRQSRLRDLERQRRQEETLRTGRDPDVEHAAATQRDRSEALAQLAAQRQAQLQELRRRQQERLRQAGAGGAAAGVPGGATGGRAPIPPVSVQTRSAPRQTPPGGGARQTSSRQPAQRQGGAAQRPAAPPQRQTQTRQAPARQAPNRPAAARPRAVPDAPVMEEESVRRLVADAPTERTATRRQVGSLPQKAVFGDGGAGERSAGATGVLLGEELSLEDWRRAIVMQEVLGRPVALRHVEDRFA
ncbi:MAG: hypothetical protein KF866_06770 [Phycisphaeraceae bacterium]|nr:hypothetical protein [Phycisphaeraceae bacterium]